MHIFIDESGTFSSPGTAAVSAVGALVVPDRRLPYLLKRYAGLRPSLPQEKGEVKGRLLSEEQVGQVVSLLKNKGAFFEVVTTDMSLNTKEAVDTHKRGQAHGITKNLTDEHQPTLVAESWKLREQLEAMAPQLYVQSVLTFELVAIVLRHATLYYAQRMPRELEFFRWVIDAKGVRQVTPWEEWWSLVVMPMLQSKYLSKPMWHLTEWFESNTWCPRLTAAMILFGSAVQVKGLGSSLVSATKRLIAIWRSTTDRNTPRLRRRLVSLAKKPSTALSQDADVGVKWKVQRGCRASHWRTFGCLWVA